MDWKTMLTEEVISFSYIRKYKSKKLFFLLSVQSEQEFDDYAGLLEETWSMKTSASEILE